MPNAHIAAKASPVLNTPPILLDKTQTLIDALERRLGTPLITYWNSSSGSICSNDVIGLYGILQSIGQVDRLSFFIKSDGGFGEASLRMVNVLRQFVGELTALVPLECASAATMLALGADKWGRWRSFRLSIPRSGTISRPSTATITACGSAK